MRLGPMRSSFERLSVGLAVTQDFALMGRYSTEINKAYR